MTTSATAPHPPLPDHLLPALEALLNRLQPDSETLAASLHLVFWATTAAWALRPDDQSGITEAQYWQLVTDRFFPDALHSAISLGGERNKIRVVMDRITALVATLS